MPAEPRTEHRLGKTAGSRRDLLRFAKQIRKRRAGLALSQGKFAPQVGISVTQLSNIECANNWPAMPVALKLCRLLGIELPRALDDGEESRA